jgi:hypothetical protein
MRFELSLATFALLALSACGGAPQRAAMPDVTSTDQSADDMGLPSAETTQETTTATSDETTTEQLETTAE